MEGLMDRVSLIQPVLRARNILNGISEERVRELAERLDAGIKAWKLEQGVPIDEVLKTTVPRLYRRKWNPASIMSGVEVIEVAQEHELFKTIVTYPQRIAIWLLKSADNEDLESVLMAATILNEIYSKSESDRLGMFFARSGFKLLDSYREWIDDNVKEIAV